MNIRTILTGLLAFVLALLVFQWVRIEYYHTVSHELIRAAETREEVPAEPTRRILVLGDSLWAGVGATDGPSLADRLIADNPAAVVVNQAESGAKLSDGASQLQVALDEHQAPFDLIIIQLGANDILQLTDLDSARWDLDKLLARAQGVSARVVYAVSGDIGMIPVFLPPLEWLYQYQAPRYLEALSQTARKRDVAYIDLYHRENGDHFGADPDRFYARDLFHPSASGYGLWYEVMAPVLNQNKAKKP